MERHDTGAARLRTFFAIEPGESARRVAAALSGTLRERPGGDAVRWVDPGNFHVTLRFLGEIDAASVPSLVDCVGDEMADQRPFQLALERVEAFPSMRRPRVVVLDVVPSEPVSLLAAAVERGVAASGLPGDDRRFHPHLTLGRVRRGGRVPGLDRAPAPKPAPFSVREVVLFESRLASNGATYVPLERMSLGVDSNSPQFQEN